MFYFLFRSCVSSLIRLSF
ncbi:unnamed protein product [Spirodela intermedia]|uniref:Uncharacterized protein n=1 Tax=Spirodela intermedia TaxID=51605 RepID=A0A7I8JXG5_SPIIN|nr:unnamed protein product [Spirodela intermedia]